jgi:hypothetical protein
MGLKYFGGRSWAQVTREERFFCLRLYTLIDDRGVETFTRFLNDRFGLRLDPDANWELG